MYLLGRDDDWTKEQQDRPAPRRNVRLVRTTTIEPYLKDYAFFACSPLYVFAGVNFSLSDQFEAEAGKQERLLVDYQRPVLQPLGAWASLVEGIHRSVWDKFCHFLSTALFCARARKMVWQVRGQTLNLEGTNGRMILEPGRMPVVLRVFMPDGNRGRMRVTSGCPAKLWWDKPDPGIVDMAAAIFACDGQLNRCVEQ